MVILFQERTMKVTIDAQGRLVVPKALRAQAGLRPGMALELHWRGDHFEMVPLTPEPTLVERGGLLVAEPVEGEVLTAAEVETLRERLRTPSR